MTPGGFERYHRQTLLPQVGPAGQQRLARSRVLVVGCGALGCAAAEQLVRAGVGFVRIADRDIVEITNLQRQVLFDEADAADQTPKAIAAAERLKLINSQVVVEPRVVDVHSQNVEELAGFEPDQTPVDLILDGTDNVATRYLLNDVSIKHGIPWIYAACVGSEGRCMAIRPDITACLRCLFPDPPPAAELPTCDTAGVLGPAAAVAASLQVTAALRLLLQQFDMPASLVSFDLWQNRVRTISADSRRSDCVACDQRRFEFLDAPAANRSVSLCGRNAVQVQAPNALGLNLQQLAVKLSTAGVAQATPYLVRCDLAEPQGMRLTVFPDGRAIIQGTSDFDRARSIYARFVGS